MYSRNTSPSAARSLSPASFPVQKSESGRKGCGYVFECFGPNPLDAFADLVIAHSRNGRAVRNCAAERKPWERPPNARLTWPLKTRTEFRCEIDSDSEEGEYGEYPDTNSCATQHPENYFSFPMPAPPPSVSAMGTDGQLELDLCLPVTDTPSISAPSTLTPPSAPLPTPISPHATHYQARRTVASTRSPSPIPKPKEKTRATTKAGKRRSSDKTTSGRSGKGKAKPPPPPPRAKKQKKTAHTEEERKVILESDPWTLEIDVHKVRCGGCKQVIKTDRRSTYYPGLWLKHRDRCREVMRMEHEQEIKDTASTDGEAPTPIASTRGVTSSPESSTLTWQSN
ncbi:hypothetical protein C8J57DRAFT_1514568 [Mycena rebaudengoi]|nr:hypothetical protein C8J57DRAFT_1514568 [Mycena rebaudengoi]